MDSNKSQARYKCTELLTNLNIPMNVYLLGFIWADGHISPKHRHFSFEIKSSDFFFEDYLDSFGVGTISSRQRMRQLKAFGVVQKCFFSSNKKIYDFLIENDFHLKSQSEPTKILSLIPDSLKHLFFRGFFDGDGCLYVKTRNSLAFWGPINQTWDFLTNQLNLLDIHYSIIKYNYEKHYSSCVEIRKIKEIVKFFNYIYPEENFDFGLRRKFDNFMIVKSKLLNMKIPASSCIGVTFNTKIQKWTAWGRKKPLSVKTRDFLGYFLTEQEAITARLNYLAQNT